MPKSIYLQSRSDIKAIVKLLRQAKQPEAVLVVPKDSILFQVPGKIRRLRRAAQELGIDVTIATTNPGGRRLALSSGFKVLQGKETTSSAPPVFVNDLLKKRQKRRVRGFGQLSEIVKKVLPQAPKRINKRTGLSVKRIVFALAALSVIFGAVFFYFPSALITVANRSEAVARDIDIQVDTRQKEADIAALTIPGFVIEREAEGSGKFTPSGKRNIGKKASGFVQIYNFSKNTLILKSETTTLLTAGGKNYVFAQDVGGIRPTAFIGRGDEQEVDPSSLSAPVPVVAAQSGEEFNISDGVRIEIVNEVFGSKPDQLYGMASGNITGGSTLEVRVLTENDVLEGIRIVREKIISDQAASLARETEGLALLASGVKSEILEESVSHSVGDQASEFSVAVRLGIKALSYNREDVLGVVRGRIERLLPENKKLALGDGAVLESRFFVLNFEEGTGILTNHFESRIVYEINVSDLQKKVAGKSRDEISEILLSRPEIEDVNVEFTPFWVKKAPRLVERIKIEKK